jgi:predicted amidohydrolase
MPYDQLFKDFKCVDPAGTIDSIFNLAIIKGEIEKQRRC